MKQIEVTIMGHSYLLGCPEGGERNLQDAVARVDREMCAIRDAGKIKARERSAAATNSRTVWSAIVGNSRTPTAWRTAAMPNRMQVPRAATNPTANTPPIQPCVGGQNPTRRG